MSTAGVHSQWEKQGSLRGPGRQLFSLVMSRKPRLVEGTGPVGTGRYREVTGRSGFGWLSGRLLGRAFANRICNRGLLRAAWAASFYEQNLQWGVTGRSDLVWISGRLSRRASANRICQGRLDERRERELKPIDRTGVPMTAQPGEHHRVFLASRGKCCLGRTEC